MENQEGLDPKTVEANAEAQQELSGKQGDGSLSEQQKQDVVTRAEYESIVSELRGLQGKMDKDASAIEKKLTSQFEQRMEALGVKLSPEQQRELRYMQLEERLNSLDPQQVVEPAKQTQPTTVEVDEVFRTLGIEEPSTDDMRLAIQYANQPIKLAAEIAKRQLEKPNPTQASAVLPGNKTTPTTVDLDALYREFDSLKGLSQDAVLPSGKTVRRRRSELVEEMDGAE